MNNTKYLQWFWDHHLRQAVFHNHVPRARWALGRGAQVNRIFPEKLKFHFLDKQYAAHHVLGLAIQRASISMVDCLLSHGADVHAPICSNLNRSPLDEALNETWKLKPPRVKSNRKGNWRQH